MDDIDDININYVHDDNLNNQNVEQRTENIMNLPNLHHIESSQSPDIQILSKMNITNDLQRTFKYLNEAINNLKVESSAVFAIETTNYSITDLISAFKTIEIAFVLYENVLVKHQIIKICNYCAQDNNYNQLMSYIKKENGSIRPVCRSYSHMHKLNDIKFPQKFEFATANSVRPSKRPTKRKQNANSQISDKNPSKKRKIVTKYIQKYAFDSTNTTVMKCKCRFEILQHRKKQGKDKYYGENIDLLVKEAKNITFERMNDAKPSKLKAWCAAHEISFTNGCSKAALYDYLYEHFKK